MLMSMTGFGKSVVEVGNKKIVVEIKSLNSKQMDLAVRLPSAYRSKELEIRAYVAKELERGKADMVISSENLPGCEAETSVTLNVEALAAYKAHIDDISARLGIGEPSDWYSVLLRFPDVMHSDTATDISDSEAEALSRAVAEACSALMGHRRAEGVKLEAFFTRRIDAIRELLQSIEPFEKERVDKIRSRIEEGLAKIPVAEYDKGRLEQEMIFYIEKLDVNEEKQRLGQHLNYFMETMASPEPGQGKKLGFISQEMGREINTLGSKSNHAEMQRIVVKMKDALEQIKEQVLNVM